MLVSEGDADDEYARVARDRYLPRNCGVVLQRRNAHGYGGARALHLALDLQAERTYDQYAILIDTDAHWGDDERLRAQQAGIAVIEHSPCLEAVLLNIHGHRIYSNTHENKAAFERIYGAPAHRHGVIDRHFSREDFDSARQRIAALDTFLRLLRVK